jgi:hypothetical protein
VISAVREMHNRSMMLERKVVRCLEFEEQDDGCNYAM